MDSEHSLRLLRQFNASIRVNEPKLAEKAAALGKPEGNMGEDDLSDLDRAIVQESIVMRQFRPVLAVKENEAELIFTEHKDAVLWEERLRNAKPLLDHAIQAVGRVDLANAGLEWVGTGWLVAENIIVTNRHVANVFARTNGEGLSFKMGEGNRKIIASLDFLQEIDSEKKLVFRLLRPLHIEAAGGPDIALFEIEIMSGNAKLAKPIALSLSPKVSDGVAVIGYPAFDSRIPDIDLMQRMFGTIYNKKRLAPGAITRIDGMQLQHNCTTLGGNSGSAVIDLESGTAFGLHFSGTFLATNYAVRSDIVAQVLASVQSGRPQHRITAAPTPELQAVGFPELVATVTIPVTLTVSIGNSADKVQVQQVLPLAVSPPDTDADDASEATVEDYRNRRGYQASFLGTKNEVSLPSVERDAHDVLRIAGEEIELKYEHFSVVMSKTRRMCFFSAVNIDGNKSKKSTRVAWKWDPRIPKFQQIMGDCYGNPPKFSRGHMTRREDPGWGSDAAAKLGNQDSMHVTNVAPQMQAFNAPIWLALEDYALQHAREDAMKISVFTGPYLYASDPLRFGIKIPVSFWKIIVFIHDQTGKLCATGYEMSQRRSLQNEEFVYGQFKSPQLNNATQVTIRSIEARSGHSFGQIASLDPLLGDEEDIERPNMRAPLETLQQIRFIR